MKKSGRILPEIMRIPIVLTLVCNGLAYYGTRFFTAGRIHYDISGGLDDKIPFVPWTIVIYWGCYAYWIVNYVIGCRQEKEKAFRFMSADFLAKLVCLLCFMVFPTTNIRPAIEGNSIWDGFVRILYRVDAADNLFPSIHCLTSQFCFIAVRDNDRISGWYRAASLFITVSICISVLTTKQHVWIDVIAGILLAEISWLFVEKSGFSKRYADVVSKAHARMKRGRELCEEKH